MDHTKFDDLTRVFGSRKLTRKRILKGALGVIFGGVAATKVSVDETLAGSTCLYNGVTCRFNGYDKHEDCCSGYCGSYGKCDCKSVGTSCHGNYNDECCNNATCVNGTCQVCIPQGKACDGNYSNDGCCPGLTCQSGTCKPPVVCSDGEYFQPCDLNGPCHCKNDRYTCRPCGGEYGPCQNGQDGICRANPRPPRKCIKKHGKKKAGRVCCGNLKPKRGFCGGPKPKKKRKKNRSRSRAKGNNRVARRNKR